MRPLGHQQRGFLELTAELGPWPRSGWTWGSPSNGQRIADSLVARGLLERRTYKLTYGTGHGTAHHITDAGRAALEER